MFSQKTTNSRKRRLFLIVLTPIVSVLLGLSAHSIIASSPNSFLVKDDSVFAVDVPLEGTSQNSEAVPDEQLGSDNKPIITTYTVVSGDTLSGIADKFDISINTIRWANNLSAGSAIRVGQKLDILPVSGIQYTVKKGDTISGIALKFDVSQTAILDFNDLDSSDKIVPGLEIIIPDGEPIPAPKPVAKPAQPAQTVKKIEPKPVEVSTNQTTTTSTNNNGGGYYIVPAPGSRLSQGLHDGTAVDMATPIGTKILAAASGVVTLVRDTNKWNGGYGYYLKIKHDNGTETLYAHLSRIDVEVGDEVEQGQVIALSGNTGRSTGPHLHFEVRDVEGKGIKNPFINDKKGTQY